MKTRQITIETRIPKAQIDNVDTALSAYASLMGRVERTLFADLMTGKPVKKPEYQKRFGINARQFNSIKSAVDGKIKSQKSNLTNYIQDDITRVSKLKKAVAVARSKLREAVKGGDQDKKARSWAKFKGRHQRFQKVQARLARRKLQKKSGNIRICFGSRKLFNAQHYLEESGYAKHDEWLADWQSQRSRSFFLKGSKDEPYGCRNAQLKKASDGSYSLLLRLPTALEKEFGENVLVSGLKFSYMDKALQQVAARLAEREALLPVVRKQIRDEKPCNADGKLKTENQLLADYGQAMSFRLVKDKRGWRVLISVELRVEETITKVANGTLGIDLNHGHVSVCETDQSGNKVTAYDILIPRNQVTSGAYQTAACEMAKQVVEHALMADKPITLEDLDFTKKKREMEKTTPEYNRMLSTLSYAKIADAIEARAHKYGVAVAYVAPDYSSFIGRLKYGRRTDFNTHQGAAWVLARRGSGRIDSLPDKCVIQLGDQLKRDFVIPADIQNLYATSTKFRSWYVDQIKVIRKQSRQWRQCLPVSLKFAADIPQ